MPSLTNPSLKHDQFGATITGKLLRNAVKQRGEGFTDVFFSFRNHTCRNTHKTFDLIPESTSPQIIESFSVV